MRWFLCWLLGTTGCAVAPVQPSPEPAPVPIPAPAPAPLPAAPAGFAGNYAFAPVAGTGKESRTAPASYITAAVDGVTIVEPWNTLQPAQGAYDWTEFDSVAVPAIAAGKILSVGVLAGSSTPAWLYATGVGSITYQFADAGNKPCQALTVPLFWQPPFVTAYADAEQALAQHIATLAGGSQAVRIAKVAAIAGLSGELRIQNSDGSAQSGAACTPSNTPPMWVAAGYTSDKALLAWQQIAAAVATAFPGKELSQDILESPTGTAPASAGTPLETQITQAAAATYGKGIVIQWDDLNETNTAQPVIDALAAGTSIGWQTNARGGNGGAMCGTANSGSGSAACTPASYAAILAHGKALGGVTMEVHATDVLAYGAAIADAGAP